MKTPTRINVHSNFGKAFPTMIVTAINMMDDGLEVFLIHILEVGVVFLNPMSINHITSNSIFIIYKLVFEVIASILILVFETRNDNVNKHSIDIKNIIMESTYIHI